jgi:hypothetical protein
MDRLEFPRVENSIVFEIIARIPIIEAALKRTQG